MRDRQSHCNEATLRAAYDTCSEAVLAPSSQGIVDVVSRAEVFIPFNNGEGVEYWTPEALNGLVVDDGSALDKALELAEQIVANGPLAVQGMIETIRRTEGMHEEDAFKVDAEVGGRVFASADAKEGPRAFAEKRTPNFRGE